jgi:hypothetical protein
MLGLVPIEEVIERFHALIVRFHRRPRITVVGMGIDS